MVALALGALILSSVHDTYYDGSVVVSVIVNTENYYIFQLITETK